MTDRAEPTSRPAQDISKQTTGELERQKFALERTKAWLTAAAIILPVVSSMVTFMVTRQQSLEQARIEFKIKEADRRINSRIEFVKLVTEKPDRRDEIIRNWRLAFPKDDWFNESAAQSPTK